MFKASELNINDYVGYAASHVGETHNVEFQSDSKFREVAGTYTILGFEAYESPEWKYNYWKHRENETPDGANIGVYTIKLNGTKFYNGKIIKVRVSAYVQSEWDAEGAVECYKTKAIYVSNVNADTGKGLKAYKFGIIDFRVKA